jgi:hypothetical protein
MPQDDAMDQYQEQFEQHEIAKREGAAAYADAIIGMFPDLTDDKKILIREGMKAVLGGPPTFFPPRMQAEPATIDAELVPAPPQVYMHEGPDGSKTVYDFGAVCGRGTHLRREPNGTITVWDCDERILAVAGEPARKLWEWQEYHLQTYEQYRVNPAARGGRQQ